jgi:uncharacterized protein YjbI with pentapeptide repeats
LTPFSSEEGEALDRAFAKRCRSDSMKLADLSLKVLDFSNIEFKSAFCAKGLIFPGQGKFAGAMFSKQADFTGAVFFEFESVNFNGVTFFDRADFSGAIFFRADFHGATLWTKAPTLQGAGWNPHRPLLAGLDSGPKAKPAV